jgi:hypothetical protein
MAAYVKYHDFADQLVRGVHDFDAHTFKVVLSNTAGTMTQTNTMLSEITQISGTNGYTTGGTATTLTMSETTGTMTLQGTQVVFTAAGGTMGSFQYYALYNDTATSPADALIACWDHGSVVSLADGESFTIKFNNASPGTIFTLA